MSQLYLQLPVTVLFCITAAVAAQSKPGCESTCGDLQIPYPFGTKKGCYRDDLGEKFLITCDNSSLGNTANYSTSNIRVLNISLDGGEMRVRARVSYNCYEGQYYSWKHYRMWFSEFAISNDKNKFTVVGCDTYGALKSLNELREDEFSTGCSMSCRNIKDVVNGSCFGIGCCRTAVPKATKNYHVSVESFYNHTYVKDFNPCSYAFFVEDGLYNFSIQDLKDLRNQRDFPVVVNWAIENKTCNEAVKNTSSYACRENSDCHPSESDLGYLCKCKEGFQGNPYLDSSNGGCLDVNECNDTMENPCSITWTCKNFPGHYSCHCPPGYTGDGYKKGDGCTLESSVPKKVPFTEIALGITVGLLVLVILMSSLCWVHKQRTIAQLRSKHFKQNGGLMLQERLFEDQGYGHQRTKIYTEVELEKATNNFHESRILGRGGQGIVYKGILPDDTPVAIKKIQSWRRRETS